MSSPTPRLDALKKHLRGVRRRLAEVLISFGLGASLTWYYRAVLTGWLIAPAQGRLSPTGGPIFTGVTDAFNYTTHLAITGGMIAAAPVVAFHLSRLVSPLLSTKLRRFLAIFLPAAFVLFLVGVAFSYFVVLPVVLTFMLMFGVGIAVPMIRLDEYMDLAQTLLLGIGVVFELPLIMFLLAKLRIVSYEQMKRLRRYVPAAAFVFAAIISSTLEITIPAAIILLFEAGLFLAWLVRPKQPKQSKLPVL